MTPIQFFSSERQDDTLFVDIRKPVSDFSEEGSMTELKSLLEEAGQPEVHRIIIDFEQLGYFGSSMLEALRRIWNAARPHGGQMALCNLSDLGREILAKSRFDTLWPVCSTRGEALAQLRK
jgi:anti-anti-sigma factor